MILDFTTLSMTDLRNRPGEILDRVVEKGETFVIERNGRQQACLVPLSVFLPDVAPARIAAELGELEKAGEHALTTITSEKEVAIHVRSPQDGARTITILLPQNYPNTCPRVYVDPIDATAPRRFSDGALCLFGVMSSWNPAKNTARDALDNARRWLARYEIWRTEGEWPRIGVPNG